MSVEYLAHLPMAVVVAVVLIPAFSLGTYVSWYMVNRLPELQAYLNTSWIKHVCAWGLALFVGVFISDLIAVGACKINSGILLLLGMILHFSVLWAALIYRELRNHARAKTKTA